MEEWKECKLGEIATITKLAGFEFTKYIKYNETGEIIALRALNLRNGRLDLTEVKHIDKSVSDALPRSKLYKGEILFTYTGNGYGDCALVDEDDKYHLAPNICKISPNKKIADSNFLFQTIRSNAFYKQVSNYIGGSSQPTIPMETIRQLKVKLPPLSTQQKIAAILSSLDDKIELNNKININLEQQAQALFKNWFVDFEPFGGKMPEGWRVGKLSEYCNFQEGYVNPAQTHNEYFDGDVKWLRTVDINESFILNTSRTLTKCGFESAGKSAFLFKPGSIAISKSGTVGRLGIISDFMCGNRAVIGIELKEQQNLSYIHQYLKSRQTEFPDMAVGSVQKNLYVSILENLDIIIPSKEVLEKFAAICIPFYDQIKTNCVENNNLSSIRDTLLPKLMNGEIETNSNIISKR